MLLGTNFLGSMRWAWSSANLVLMLLISTLILKWYAQGDSASVLDLLIHSFFSHRYQVARVFELSSYQHLRYRQGLVQVS